MVNKSLAAGAVRQAGVLPKMDVVERNDAAHPQAVLDLALRLINQVGSMFSVNALTGYLKSLGHRTSKTFVGDCVNWCRYARV